MKMPELHAMQKTACSINYGRKIVVKNQSAANLFLQPFLYIGVCAATLTACGGDGDSNVKVADGIEPQSTALAVQAAALPIGDSTVTISSGGYTRTYNVHVPSRYASRSGPVPVVVLYHKTGGDPSGIASLTGFTAKSDKEGFVLVMPQGLVGASSHVTGWNAYNSFWGSINGGPDDVQFSRDLVIDVSSRLQIDSKRVFATGFSAGGFMSYRVGQLAADVFAAVAPVAANIQKDQDGIVPVAPVSIIAFHDVNDTTAPYNGGVSSVGDNLIPDGPKRTGFNGTTMAWWVLRNSCGSTPAIGSVVNTKIYTYPGCPTGTGISFYASQVAAGGAPHSWPGATDSSTTKNTDGNATNAMWDFFRNHPKTTP
jgi:polyhydroxybutyrate depolymerase